MKTIEEFILKLEQIKNESKSKICTIYRSELSYSGFTLDVLKSALQKYARRGELNKCCKVLYEFDTFFLKCNTDSIPFNKDCKRILTNLIHRIIIIFFEDLGYPAFDKLSEFTNLIEKCIKDNYNNRLNRLYLFTKIGNIIGNPIINRSREGDIYKSVFYISLHPNILSSEKRKLLIDKYPQLYDFIFKSIEKNYSIKINLNEEKQVLQYVSNFYQLLKNGNDSSIYYAFLIANIEKTNVSYYRRKSGHYLLFAILEYFIKNELQYIQSIQIIKNESISKFYPLFSNDKTILNNEKKLLNVLENCLKMFIEIQNCKENFLCWLTFILYLLKLICNTSVKNTLVNTDFEDQFIIKHYNDIIDNKLLLEEEYIYDMHTRYAKNRSKAYFVEVSSTIINEVNEVNISYKEIYKLIQCFDD
jgi:hypothetical protein